MRNLALALICTLALSACASLDEIKRVEPQGSPFAVALSKLYKDFAESEAEQYDWTDAYYFADKGLDAAYGRPNEPENLSGWNLTQDIIPTLADARAKLIAALHQGNIDKKPEVSAKALVMFDCWVEQQEENWQAEHIAACRDGFYEALNELSDKPEPEDETGIQFTPTPVKSEEVATSYVIFFGLNSTAITKEGKQVVSEVKNELADDTEYVIRLEGHADRSGTEKYNMELSRRRAVAVRAALERQGLTKGNFSIVAHGEEMPLITTKDGVREKANRRVEIFINE